MSILSDHQVKDCIQEGSIIIDPYFEDFQGPNLYYCHLGTKFLIPKDAIGTIDPLISKSNDIFREIETREQVVIPSKGFILAETFEYFGSNEKHVIRLLNSSSLARVGVIQAALGMINAGCGMETPVKLTLEMFNASPFDIVLRPTTISDEGVVSWGTEVLKVGVETLSEATKNPYDTWQYAIYSQDQKPSGPKMIQRSAQIDKLRLKIPKDSLHHSN